MITLSKKQTLVLLSVAILAGCRSTNNPMELDEENGDVGQSPPGWFWQNPLPQGQTLNAVAFSDANIVGRAGSILSTTDGGGG